VLTLASQIRHAVQQVAFAIRGQTMPDLGSGPIDVDQALQQLKGQDDKELEPEEEDVEVGGGVSIATHHLSLPIFTKQDKPSSVFSTEPPRGSIAAAALSLKKETDRWSAKGNPVVETASVS